MKIDITVPDSGFKANYGDIIVSINLERADDEERWTAASRLINSVAVDLKLKGFGLRVETQVAVSELKKCYKLR